MSPTTWIPTLLAFSALGLQAQQVIEPAPGNGNAAQTMEFSSKLPESLTGVAWKVQTYTKGQVVDPTGLLVAGDRIYLTNSNGIVACLNRQSGQEIWTSSLGEGATTAPVLRNGILFLAHVSGRVIGLDAGTGRESVSLPFDMPMAGNVGMGKAEAGKSANFVSRPSFVGAKLIIGTAGIGLGRVGKLYVFDADAKTKRLFAEKCG